MLVRKKYNKEYFSRPEVIEKEKIKNARPEMKLKRKLYKKTLTGKIAERRYRVRNNDKIKSVAQIRRIKRYGMTSESLKLMVINQGNKCKICFQPFNKPYHIDHCHKTNKIRGLLCTRCNLALGLFKDDILRLESAIRYLQYAIYSNNSITQNI